MMAKFLCGCCTALLLLAAPVLGATAQETMEEDFTGYASGAFAGGNGWAVMEKAYAGGSITVEDTAQGRALCQRLRYIPNSQGERDSFSYIPGLSAGRTVAEAVVAVTQMDGGNFSLMLRDDSTLSSSSTITLALFNGGTVRYLPGLGGCTRPYTLGQKLRITAVIDGEADTLILYEDGTEVCRAEQFRQAAGGLYQSFNLKNFQLRFYNGVNTTDGAVIESRIYRVYITGERSLIPGLHMGAPILAARRDSGAEPTRYLSAGPMELTAPVENHTDEVQRFRLLAGVYREGILCQVSQSQVELAPKEAERISLTVDGAKAGKDGVLRLFAFGQGQAAWAEPAEYRTVEEAYPLGREILEKADAKTQGAHPRLLADAETFRNLAAAIPAGTSQADVQRRRWFAQVKAEADRLLTAAPVSYTDADALRLACAETFAQRVWYLGLLYWLADSPEQQTAYRNRLWREVETVLAFPDWNPPHFLDTAGIAAGVALAYDWLYPVWTSEEREAMAQGIRAKALLPAQKDLDMGAWWTTTDTNWNTVCGGGIGLACLALYEEPEHRALCTEMLDRITHSLKAGSLPGFAPDGAWIEGVSYWRYTVQYLSLYLGGLLSCTGEDCGILDTPGLRETGFYPIYMTTGLTANLNDATEARIEAPEFFFLAGCMNQPAYGGYRYEQLTRLGMRATPKDLLWFRPEWADADYSRGLATARQFSREGTAVFRQNWSRDGAFALLHGGRNDVNHGHLDAGSFLYEAEGVRWAIDLGGDGYNLFGYFDTNLHSAKNRYAYYRVRAEGHNTLALNPGLGPDQQVAAGASFTGFSQAGWAAVDLTQVLAPYAAQALRGLRLDGATGGLLLRDEVTLTEPAEIHWFMQTRATFTPGGDGRSAILTQDGKRLWIGILEGEGALTATAAQPLATSPNPNLWPENQSHAGDGTNPKTQDGNAGVSRLEINLTGRRGTNALAVYMAPLAPGETAPKTLPEPKPIATWNEKEANS